MGAALLAAEACLRSGVGLVTAHIPSGGEAIMQAGFPEAMVSLDPDPEFFSSVPEMEQYNAVGIGPGLDVKPQSEQALVQILKNAKQPLVLDADALNILSENKTWMAFLPPESILTPHPKEFERLVGKWDTDEERFEIQKQFSLKHGVCLVLKGGHTSISVPDGTVYFNSTGNPGMSTAGSGDVLTGVITGLLVQGYSSIDACCIGVYLHGLAGDIR